jgi:hypothetical protein
VLAQVWDLAVAMHLSLQFWAKSFSTTAGSSTAHYKPVAHHLLDVAAVAKTYLESNAHRLEREASLVRMDRERYARLMAFLAGLHDLGKSADDIGGWYMEKIEVAVGGVQSVQAFPPEEAVLIFRTTSGQDVSLHIRPKDLHFLLSRLLDIAKKFPAGSNEREDG